MADNNFKDSVTRLRAQFTLDHNQGWALGVCAGLARSLRLEPTVVRVFTVVAGLFFPKVTIAAYLVLWLVLDNRKKFSRRSD